MRMISAIEHLHASAANTETPLAPQPLIYFLNETESHLNKLSINTDAIRDFMEPHVGGDLYGHMFLGIIPKDHMGGSLGSVSTELFEFEGATYFPKINLRVGSNGIPDMKKLNAVLRHELAHTLEPANSVAPYNNPKIVAQARGVGSALLAATTVLGNEYVQSVFEMGQPGVSLGAMGLGAMGLAGAAALLTPKGMMHRFSAKEMQADLFAFKHRSFSPIAYS